MEWNEMKWNGIMYILVFYKKIIIRDFVASLRDFVASLLRYATSLLRYFATLRYAN